MRVLLYELRSNFTSCKFILRVGNKITSCESLFASCELLSTSWKFKKIILRVTSCVLWVAKLKILFYELPVAFYDLKVYDDKFTSWKFKMMTFTSCEVAFYKLNVYDVNFTNCHHMVESNFKGINLRKLCQEPILIKCILTFDNSSSH